MSRDLYPASVWDVGTAYTHQTSTGLTRKHRVRSRTILRQLHPLHQLLAIFHSRRPHGAKLGSFVLMTGNGLEVKRVAKAKYFDHGRIDSGRPVSDRR